MLKQMRGDEKEAGQFMESPMDSAEPFWLQGKGSGK